MTKINCSYISGYDGHLNAICGKHGERYTVNYYCKDNPKCKYKYKNEENKI